ncbi:MAG: histidine kinase dimerization/phospho-acceptor domain-containing protein [Coprococcus sp.]
MMKGSIKTKITLCLMAIIAFMIALSCAISLVFVKKYYYKDIKDKLIATYKSCNREFSEIRDYDEKTLTTDVSNEADAMIYIVDDINNKIYTSVNENSTVFDNLKFIAEFLGISQNANAENSQIYRKEIERHRNYNIQITRDKKTNSSYFDIVGFLDNGFVIIIRTSVSRIDATIKTTVKFVFTVLAIVAIIGCVIMYFFSNIFARPIKKLTNVAERMSKLDFDAKVENPSNDEIGELAIYMNELSFRLKNTLNELQQANARLQTDIDEKIMIDEMRKEFLSHVSHELKTPIALIQGYAEGLMDNINDDEENKDFYCEVIMDEAAKMNKLVKQLLDLNEIEFGNNRINPEVFDIDALIRNVIDSSAILIEQSKCNMLYEEQTPLYVYADEFMIEEVFTNYLTNALHYCTEGGKVRVWTAVSRYDKTLDIPEKGIITGNVRVFVYDEGPTIPVSELDKVFIKFYKVDKARTREYGGSGIGLSIVAASMQAHNKMYGVYNVEDGVVFYFDLDIIEPLKTDI